jgi:hypothetical protein
MHTEFYEAGRAALSTQNGDDMASREHEIPKTKSYVVQCSADNFEHAAWLSAVYSEVLSVNEQAHRLHIFPVTDLLMGQFEKMGASVSKSISPL